MKGITTLIRKAVAALIKRGLADEIVSSDESRCWREEGGQGFAVVITNTGRAAILLDKKSSAEPLENMSAPIDPAAVLPA